MLWIIGMLVVGGLAVFLVLPLVGSSAPAPLSGRAYLPKQLNQYGIGEDQVPDSCVDEFVAAADKGAKGAQLLAKKQYSIEFVGLLDVMAHDIRVWIANADMSAAAREREIEPSYREVLEKHGVQ